MHSTLFFWWGANETVVFSTSNRATLSQCAQLTYVGCYGNMQSRMKLLPSGIALVQSTSQSHHTPICFIGQAHTSSAIAAFSSGVTSSNPIQASHLPHTHVHSMHTCPCTHSTRCTACTAQQAAQPACYHAANQAASSKTKVPADAVPMVDMCVCVL